MRSLLTKEIEMEDEKIKCDCGKDGKESHTCPYAEDVNNDSDSLCNCCEGCEHECCMDI